MRIGLSARRQNMMLPFFTGFVSSRLIRLKVNVIAILIIGFAGLKHINNPSDKTITTDNCQVNGETDSIGYLKVMDSTSFN